MQAPHVNTNIDAILPISSTKEARNHDIVNFLQRAYEIDNFLWTKTSPRGTVLATYRFPDQLLAKAALAAKTLNFFGLRAGVEFIVLVNKQQFQAGNLLVSYLPNAKYNPSKVAMAQLSLPTITGMPRVNLDLMDATRATLSVPYASPFIYYNLLTGDGTIGDFQITVYSPLTDVADTGTVSVQVLARFIDVDLEFPTGSLPMTFSSIPTIDKLMDKLKGKPNLADLKQLVKEGTAIMEKIRLNEFKFQMNSENTLVSNFKQRALPNMAVSSGEPNNAHVMSLSSSNVLPNANQGQTSNSETNLTEAMQIACYHDNFPISNQASGVNVWSKQVSPLIPASTNLDGSINVDYVYFHAQPFSKWRGSLIYHFRAVKTTFHSLRIRVWFSPASVIGDTIDRNAVYSKIIDLKDTNHWTFEVPFIWPHPFLNVHTTPSSLGVIGVDIINQMVFPATVSDTIDVIVERSAGTDFCLNLPTVIATFPYDPTILPALRTTISVSSGSKKPDVIAPAIQNSNFNLNHYQQKMDELAANADYINSKTNLIPQVKSYLVSNAANFKIRNIDLLDTLAKDEKVDLRYVHLSPVELLKRISVHDELRKKRDLTKDGDVEKNPGPIAADRTVLNTGTLTGSVTSPFTGPQTIQVFAFNTVNANQQINLTGSLTGNLFLWTANNFSKLLTFQWTDLSAPSFTVSAPSIASGTVNVVFTFSVIQDPLPVLVTSQPIEVAGLVTIPEPVDVNIVSPDPLPVAGAITIAGPLPLPITGGGGGSSIVTTTSVAPFHFQMNAEQDVLRTGFDDNTFQRPQPSARADSLSLGQTVSRVHDMIGRSSLFASVTPPTVTNNLIQVLPHMFGNVQVDTDGFIHQNACDLLSYYANSYAFARGGINLRVVSAPDFYYNVILDPDSNFYPAATKFGAVVQQTAPPTTTQIFQLNNPLQQVVKPSTEGFGEISVPFYSDTFMYSVSPTQALIPNQSNSDLTLPYTQLVINPNGAFTQFNVYRAACSDFEFSYLNGPPILQTVPS